MDLDNYEVFIQLGVAIHDLVRFYNEITASSRVQINNSNPARGHCQLAVGILEIIFRSNDPIPWEWMAEFGSALVSALVNNLDPGCIVSSCQPMSY